MADACPVIQEAPQACLACRSKKRKCDRSLPSCSRCRRVSQTCQYANQLETVQTVVLNASQTAWGSGTNIEQPSSLTSAMESPKAKSACQRCREGKRLCSRELARCSRCAQMGVPCIYDRPLPKGQRDLAMQGSSSTACASSSQQTETVEEVYTEKRRQSLLTIDHNGHAHLDPFQSYPSSLSPDCISRVLTYSIKEMWPALFPGFTYKGVSFVHHWMKSAMSCPPLFNAWLHSGAEHMQLQALASDQVMSPSRRDAYELLLMEREAILGLKEFVDTGNPEKVTDEIIMSALALALHPPERKRSATARMQLAPLSNLQWLSRFTDIVISDGNVAGLRHLVEARGGFDKLEMPGLKQGLSSFNLIVASKSLSRPFWPLRTPLQADQVAEFLSAFERTYTVNKKELLHSYLDSILPAPMSWEFHAVRGYSALLDGYSNGLYTDLDLGYILNVRNIIHYHLMSLPPAVELIVTHPELSPTYETLRLALIAYSLLVLFPVPLTTDPYPRLSRLLRAELETTGMNVEIWMPMVELLLWALTLGGIAALGTEDRPWYVRRLGWLVGIYGVETWAQMKQMMASIIWLDVPCDVEGFALWEEVQESVQFGFEEFYT